MSSAAPFTLPFSNMAGSYSTTTEFASSGGSPTTDDDGSNCQDASSFLEADLDDEDGLSDNEFGGAPSVEDNAANKDAPAPSKRRGRRAPSTAAKRANHNAIERARRESLNGRFIELAKALPNMASVKRPSKSAIVIKSLEYVYQVQARRDETEALRKEVNELRAQLGLPPRSPGATPKVVTKTANANKKVHAPIVTQAAPAKSSMAPMMQQPSSSPYDLTAFNINIPLARTVSASDASSDISSSGTATSVSSASAYTPPLAHAHDFGAAIATDVTTAEYYQALLAPMSQQDLYGGAPSYVGNYLAQPMPVSMDCSNVAWGLPQLPFGGPLYA